MENLKKLPIEQVALVTGVSALVVDIGLDDPLIALLVGACVGGGIIFYQQYTKPKPVKIYRNMDPPPLGGWATSKYH